MSTERYEPSAHATFKSIRLRGDIPADGSSGHSAGTIRVHQTTGVLYQNMGTSTSCKYKPGPKMADTANGKSYYLQATNGVLTLVEV
jgi:hypothetical protein